MFLLSLWTIFLFCECHLLQELKLSLLISKLNETETAMAQIETAAADQLQSLALQSEQALEGAQKKLLAASETLEEFTTFVKVWVIDALLTCTYFRQRPCPPPEDLAETSSSLLLVVLMLFGMTSTYIYTAQLSSVWRFSCLYPMSITGMLLAFFMLHKSTKPFLLPHRHNVQNFSVTEFMVCFKLFTPLLIFLS